MNIRKSPIEPV